MRPENLGFEDCDLDPIFRTIEKRTQTFSNNNYKFSKNTGKLPLPRDLNIDPPPISVHSNCKTEQDSECPKQNNLKNSTISDEYKSLLGCNSNSKNQPFSKQSSSENVSTMRDGSVSSCISDKRSLGKDSDIDSDDCSMTQDEIINNNTASILSTSSGQQNLQSTVKSNKCLAHNSTSDAASMQSDKYKKPPHSKYSSRFFDLLKELKNNNDKNSSTECGKHINIKHFKNGSIKQFSYCLSCLPGKNGSLHTNDTLNTSQDNDVTCESFSDCSNESITQNEKLEKGHINKYLKVISGDVSPNKYSSGVQDKKAISLNQLIIHGCKGNLQKKCSKYISSHDELSSCSVLGKNNSYSMTTSSTESLDEKLSDSHKKHEKFYSDDAQIQRNPKEICFEIKSNKIMNEKKSTCNDTNNDTNHRKCGFCEKSTKIYKKKCVGQNINKNEDREKEFNINMPTSDAKASNNEFIKMCPKKKQLFEDTKGKERETLSKSVKENDSKFPKDCKSDFQPNLSSCDKNRMREHSGEDLSIIKKQKFACKSKDLKQDFCETILKNPFNVKENSLKDSIKDKELNANLDEITSSKFVVKKKCTCKDREQCKIHKEYPLMQMDDNEQKTTTCISPDVREKKSIQKCPLKKQSFEDFCRERQKNNYKEELNLSSICPGITKQYTIKDFSKNTQPFKEFCKEKEQLTLFSKDDECFSITGNSKSSSEKKTLSNPENLIKEERLCLEIIRKLEAEKANSLKSCNEDIKSRTSKVFVEDELSNKLTNKNKCSCQDKSKCKTEKELFKDCDNLNQVAEVRKCTINSINDDKQKKCDFNLLNSTKSRSSNGSLQNKQIFKQLSENNDLDSDLSTASLRDRNLFYIIENKRQIYSENSVSEFGSIFSNLTEGFNPLESDKSYAKYLGLTGAIFGQKNSNSDMTCIRPFTTERYGSKPLEDQSLSNLSLTNERFENNYGTQKKNKAIVCKMLSKHSKKHKKCVTRSSKSSNSHYKKKSHKTQKKVSANITKESHFFNELGCTWSQYIGLTQKGSDEEFCRIYKDYLSEQESNLESITLNPQSSMSELNYSPYLDSSETSSESEQNIPSIVEKLESTTSIPVTGAGHIKSNTKENTVWDNCLSILLGSGNAKKSDIETSVSNSCHFNMDTDSGSKKCFTNPIKQETEPNKTDVIITEDSKKCTVLHSIDYNKEIEKTCKITINRLPSVKEDDEIYSKTFGEKVSLNKDDSTKGRPIPSISKKTAYLDKEKLEALSEAHGQTMATIKYAMKDIAGKVRRTTSEVAAGAVTRIQSESAKQIEIFKNYKHSEDSEHKRNLHNTIREINDNKETEKPQPSIYDQIVSTVSSTVSFISDSVLGNMKYNRILDKSSEYDVPDPNINNKNCKAKPVTHVAENNVSMNAMLVFIKSKFWNYFISGDKIEGTVSISASDASISRDSINTSMSRDTNDTPISADTNTTSMSANTNESETESDEDLMNKLIE